MADCKWESLFGCVGSDLDGIDVNTAGNAWLKAPLVIRVCDVLAWTRAKDYVVGLDLLHPSDQLSET